jgi:hypothetical protein
MATVRCPSCKRALNLPEHADISTACCPLCQTTFDVADVAAAPPRPVARATPVSPRVDTSAVGGPSPLDFDGPGQRLSHEDRKALSTAGYLLQGAGVLGILHSLFCWCGTIIPMEGAEALVAGCCFVYVLQVVASAYVYRGGRELLTFQQTGHARTAVIVAFLAVGLEMVFAVPPLAFIRHKQWSDGEELLIVLFIAGLRILLVALFLTAAIKTSMALNRPGVRQALPRS